MDACEYLPCGVSPGLRRVLKGQPHWSCCLLVDYDAPCPKARGRGCRRDHDTCNKSVTCFSSILYDRVERAIEAEEEAHVVFEIGVQGGRPDDDSDVRRGVEGRRSVAAGSARDAG